jgi:hypothetical protein
MKIYFDNPTKSIAIDRVVLNLERYMPTEFIRVATREEADLIILHVFGRNNHVTKDTESILNSGKKYAVIQYAIKSTRNPDSKDWKTIWDNAQVVWSYYNLGGNFYHAPLAADPDIFINKNNTNKDYLIGSLSVKECYHAECIGEVHLATFKARGKAIHIGEVLVPNPAVTYVSNISDLELVDVYNNCHWFSCLRRKEGFEVTAIEALLCGARPIMFDTPNYRQWFDGLVEFIPESSVRDTSKHLARVILGEPKPVTDSEIEEIKRRFNWKLIIEGFWKKCMT